MPPLPPKFNALTPYVKPLPTRKGEGRGKGGGTVLSPAPKVTPKPTKKKQFAERLADKTREKRNQMTPAQKAENDRKAAEGRKRKAEELAAAGAPSAKRERVDIKSLPDSEKAKIKCKFWSTDPEKNKCLRVPQF